MTRKTKRKPRVYYNEPLSKPRGDVVPKLAAAAGSIRSPAPCWRV